MRDDQHATADPNREKTVLKLAQTRSSIALPINFMAMFG